MAHLRPLWRWAFPVGLLAVLMNIFPRAARPQEQEALPHLTPDEVRLYQQARTVMDWSPEEIRSRPELKNLLPAESQRDLPMILQKVGERVAMLFEKLPDTTFMEKVGVRGQNNRPQGFSGFSAWGYGNRYLLLVRSRQGMPVLEEYRINAELNLLGLLDLPPNPNKNAVDYVLLPFGSLRVSRFLATALNFLPQMQATCRFRYLGRQGLNERESEVVGFAQIPEGDPAVNTFRNPDKTVGLLVQGLAWFDPKTYEMQRIQTDLLAPRPELGLKGVSIKIDFSAVHIEGVQLIRRGETPPTFQLPT